MEMTLLTDLLKVLTLAAVALFLCNWARLPGLVGLLLTGVLCGPSALGLVRDVSMVQSLAEIGVVMLLFTIGLEFSLSHLLRLRRAVLLGGGLQVVVTILLCAGAAELAGLQLNRAVFLGFLVSLSSTAIVLKVIQGRGEIDAPHGRLMLAILIFQDVVILAMMLLTPLLAGRASGLARESLWIVAKLAGVAAFVFVGARLVMPQFMFHVVRTRSRELFMLTIVLICMATPWLAHQLGLSAALGAFIAGLIISETDYAHQALAGFAPMRDVFTSLFFVSIGMLLDVGILWTAPVAILLGVALLILLKTVAAGAVVLWLHYPLRTAILTGLGLAQVGEFSFILAGTGWVTGLLDPALFQLFIAVTIVSMALTPLLIAVAPRLAEFAAARWGAALSAAPAAAAEKTDHVVIIGFGLSGRNLARCLREAGVPYVVLEMNAETVRREKAAGEPIFYGDASHEAILEHAGVRRARTLVISVADPSETRKIARASLRLNPALHVVARTRFAGEVPALLTLGAGDVIADEYEASLELTARVLRRHLVPRDVIERFIDTVRADGYEVLRNPGERTLSLTLDDLRLRREEADIRVRRIGTAAAAVGQSLSRIELRRRYGQTLLAVRRGGRVIVNPDPDETILADDEWVLFGTADGLELLRELI